MIFGSLGKICNNIEMFLLKFSGNGKNLARAICRKGWYEMTKKNKKMKRQNKWNRKEIDNSVRVPYKVQKDKKT